MLEEHSKNIGKVIKWSLVLIFILALFLAVLTVNALKEYGYIGKGVYPTQTLSVTGEGEVFAKPDVAQFNFTVSKEGDSVDSASQKVTATIDSALATLAELGVEDEDIKTTGYNAYPRYTYPQRICLNGICPQEDRVLSGYEVSQTIAVKIRNTAEAGEALGKVAQAGVTNVSSLQFVVDDKDAFVAQARAQAIADAKEKIDQLAANLGVRVKGVVSFSEDFGNQYPRYELAMNESFGGDAKSSSPQLPAGENSIHVQVYITYEIK